MIICKNSNKFWNFDVISISLNVLRVPRLIECFSLICWFAVSRARVSTERRQHSTAARKELKLAGNADRGTTRNWLNGKLSTAMAAAAAAVAAAAATAALPSHPHTHTHTYTHSHTQSEQESESASLLRAYARGTVDGSLEFTLSLSLSLPLPRSLSYLSLSHTLFGLLARSRAWFISGRCVWYSFDC